MTDQPNPSDGTKTSIGGAISENRWAFTLLAVLLIVFGLLAIIFPFMSGIAVTVLVGWLLFIGGIVQIVHAFSVKKWGGFLLSLLVGALYVFTGGWIAFFPLAGIITLTVLLSIAFLVQGVLETVMAFRLRDHKEWGWMLASGIIAIVVGGLIFAELPSSAAWAIGLLTGINLMSSGFAFLFIAQGLGNRRTTG